MTKKVSETNEGVISNHPLINAVKQRFRNFFKIPKSLLFLFSAIIFQNCTQPTEGCLDIRATNFDVTASKACDKNCECTYPSLIVASNYLIDTNNFNYNTTYKNDLKDSFRIVAAQMYLSDFQLINDKNVVFRTIDSVALTRINDTIRVLNNYALVGKSVGFDFAIGSFNGVGLFSKIKFKVGLDDVALKTIPSKMPTTHPLSKQADSMYISSQSQYIFNKFVIAKGLNFKDTLRINITTPIDIELTKPLTFIEGFNAKIPLNINYLAFFKDVKFSETEEQVKKKIVDNTKDVFSIK